MEFKTEYIIYMYVQQIELEEGGGGQVISYIQDNKYYAKEKVIGILQYISYSIILEGPVNLPAPMHAYTYKAHQVPFPPPSNTTFAYTLVIYTICIYIYRYI